MNSPTSAQILRLYRDLLRYGQELKYTNKNYFYKRIKTEFKRNKDLSNFEEIEFNYKVSDYFRLYPLCSFYFFC